MPFNGDVSPQQTWAALQDNPKAVLVDVRTRPEWTFVGGPDLSVLAKAAVQIEWLLYPSMQRNTQFVEQLQLQGIAHDQPIYLLCRSGARSLAAAELLGELGYSTYNILDGFEGQLGSDGHRGNGGWRAAGLPWKQS